ncbi:MAG: PIN domain-containing protein [Actinomycetota bacterium]
MKGLLDTSVFIAREQGRPLGLLPDEAAISVATLAELHIGVLATRESRLRAQRLRTLSAVERTFDALPIDDRVARAFAEISVEARKKGRSPKVMDVFIAATAVTHGLPVYTQDQDFSKIPIVKVMLV